MTRERSTPTHERAPLEQSGGSPDLSVPPATTGASPAQTSGGWIRRGAAGFWLRALMRAARDAPWLARAFCRPAVWATWRFSRSIRAGTLANAARVLGNDAGAEATAALARRVVGNFFDFVCDMGRNRCLSVAELAALVGEVEGEDNFARALSHNRGVVIVTAHLGSFETAVASLRTRAERVHVVFKRDSLPVFEAMRSEQRRRLGVIEAAVDDGWPMWLRLRNALLMNEIVLMQGDRLMPGQRGERVPFLGGHIELPTGPAKLALAAGSMLLPVFAVKTVRGGIKLIVDEPIDVDPDAGAEQLRTILLRLGEAIERRVSHSPEQWLMLHPVWCEDRATTIPPRAAGP